ncbi:MAG: type III secretion system export apparatus subunit SctR [Burkholderiaceae bacterium]
MQQLFGDYIGLLLAVLAISLLPFIAMMVTSYAKIVVVLGLLRNALGVQQVPPNMVLNGIALLVTMYIMAPLGIQAMTALQQSGGSGNTSAQVAVDVAGTAREPFRKFLSKHADETEKRFFLHSAAAIWPKDAANQLQKDDFIVLAPAFTLTEMTDAFKIGFLLYLAFIVVDLIIANILLAMGLNQVTPINIAIPFKLLLFTVISGWSVLIHGLVLSYK